MVTIALLLERHILNDFPRKKLPTMLLHVRLRQKSLTYFNYLIQFALSKSLTVLIRLSVYFTNTGLDFNLINTILGTHENNCFTRVFS